MLNRDLKKENARRNRDFCTAYRVDGLAAAGRGLLNIYIPSLFFQGPRLTQERHASTRCFASSTEDRFINGAPIWVYLSRMQTTINPTSEI